MYGYDAKSRFIVTHTTFAVYAWFMQTWSHYSCNNNSHPLPFPPLALPLPCHNLVIVIECDRVIAIIIVVFRKHESIASMHNYELKLFEVSF